MIKNLKYLFLIALVAASCSEDETTPVNPNSSDGMPLTAGSANFSKYVAVGNSLTAGFSDGTLFIEGQNGAYTALMARQFALVGGGEFRTPLMADNIGGFRIGGNVVSGPRLFFNGAAPVPVAGTPSTEILTKLTGAFNNMGVPGAKIFHLLAPNYGNPAGLATGAANPFFARFASTPAATVLADAVAQSPTFFSLWIGNNDVLAYATSGGTGVNQTGNLNPATYGGNDITDPTLFASVFNTLLDGTNGLMKGGAKGVVANIPNVTSVPYFTTVPHNSIPGLPAASAAQLNQLFGGINQLLTVVLNEPARFATLVADDGVASTIESNPLLIVDESQPDRQVQITAALTPAVGAATAAFLGSILRQARHARNTATARDFIVLPARTIIGTVQATAPAPFNTLGVSFPLPDSSSLTASEAAEVKAATDAYNSSIRAIATAKGLAFVDANAVLNQVGTAAGITANGFQVTASYVTGGAFSLDGVHPSPRGYALIANEFMKAINATYGSNFKALDLGNYRIQFPGTL